MNNQTTLAERLAIYNQKIGVGSFNHAPSILRDLQQAVGVLREARSALNIEGRYDEESLTYQALSKIDELLGE